MNENSSHNNSNDSSKKDSFYKNDEEELKYEDNNDENDDESSNHDPSDKSFTKSDVYGDSGSIHQNEQDSINNYKDSNDISHNENKNYDEYDLNINDEELKEELQYLDENFPERKVRYKILKFINNLRKDLKLNEFKEDFISNSAANDYAIYLLNENENINEFNKILKENYFVEPSEAKLSVFSCCVDNQDISSDLSFDNLTNEFLDCHATLLEFEKDRNLILSSNLNSIGIGLSFDKDKLIVVNIFSQRFVFIDYCNIIEDSQTIYLEGRITNDKYGVFSVRIVEETNQNKTILSVNPQNIFFDSSTKKWNCKFKNIAESLQDIDLREKRLYIQVYLRDQPELIKYGEAFTGQIKYNNLILGCKVELNNFPQPIIVKEQENIDSEEKQNKINENQRKKDEEKAENDERNRRNKKNKDGSLEPLQEVPEDSQETESISMSGNSNLSPKKDNQLDEQINIGSLIEDKRDTYNDQLMNLEKTLDQLKKENEEVQKNIALIFEFRKLENNDDKKHYKESNINESTYYDTLTTAANLYNDLHTHRTKLNADMSKYDQSIKIQEERKREVYKILMNYKEELLNNAEDTKGLKIPQKQIEYWLSTENQNEEEIRKLRIDHIKNTLKLNRINKEQKKNEEYFEGLHYIDFEQLKIENNVRLYLIIT